MISTPPETRKDPHEQTPTIAIARRRRRGASALGARSTGAVLAAEADDFPESVPRGRRHRHVRATDRGEALAAARRAGADREPGRRGRHRGRGERREARARRLQLVLWRRAPYHRREPLRPAALQPRA